MQDTLAMQAQMKELGNTLFLMNGLQSQLANERELLTTAAGKVAFLVNNLEGISVNFEKSTATTQNHIEETIKKETMGAAKVIAEEASRYLREKTEQQIQDMTSKLSLACDYAHNRVEQCGEKISYLSKGFVAVVFALTFLGGGIGGALVHYMTTTSQQSQPQEVIEAGHFFLKIWSKLDKKDRDKLTTLYQQQKS